MKNSVSTEIMDILEKELPLFFSRDTAAEKLNGIFSKETLANLEYKRVGPPVVYMGRKPFYLKRSFIDWMWEYLGGIQIDIHGNGGDLHNDESPPDGIGKGC